MIRVAERLSRLGTETAFAVLNQARRLEAAGREVVHLEIGQPDFPTPPHIVEAGIRALRDGTTGYAPPAGIPELRQAIADSARTRGLPVGPENVFVTSGCKPMLYYALTGLVEPGDEVLVPDPGFPIYESVVRSSGGQPVGYRVSPDRPEVVDVDEIAGRISARTRVLVLNSPNNPTGAVLSLAILGALAELALRHDLVVVSDEIYSRLVFGAAEPSIAALPGMAGRTIVVDGFSKAYAMTGWRLGYGIVPAELGERLERFIVNTTSCAPPFVQRAGVAALTGPQDAVDTMRETFRARRDLVVAGLDGIDGVSCAPPRGAFYAFPNVSGILRELELTTERFAELLLHEHGLACLAGTAFGAGGTGCLRLSFAAAQPELLRGLELLRQAASAGLRPAAPIPQLH